MQPTLPSTFDYRREKLYHDRGDRQTINPHGLTRAEMDTYESARTAREESPNAMFVSEEKPERDYRWMSQVWNNDQETYKAQISMVYRPSQQTMSSQLLHEFKKQLASIDKVPSHQPGRRHRALNGLYASILHAYRRDVRKDDLEAEELLPRLEKFLSPGHAQTLKDMRISDFLIDQLTIVYKKWAKGDYLSDPDRGLDMQIHRDQNGTEIRKTFRLNKEWEFYVDHRHFGAGDLVNGQIWYSRKQLMRDGVHGCPVGGISGSSNEGAYAVIVGLKDGSHRYTDLDLLQSDSLIYEGTSLDKPTPPGEKVRPKPVTQAMLRSNETGLPVRVIRAVLTESRKKAYRYDGLYQVTGSSLLDEALQRYTFTMKRFPGQSAVLATSHAPAPPTAKRTKRNHSEAFQGSSPGHRQYGLNVRGPPSGY